MTIFKYNNKIIGRNNISNLPEGDYLVRISSMETKTVRLKGNDKPPLLGVVSNFEDEIYTKRCLGKGFG